ncbi:E3 ubiquitin-protein ligase LRSAM1-like isoform X2 [Stegodyphus dumicola]|uniref:E3 ubiquitin-protein ligase LRSAM1-like isoform X2 n=1 Tax=Stegodyphus dumicola TaxID=202533 RepID=UPI0015AF96EE|nr:E3 ubiquitin-protein ligase LRSAM1-like isoform X2 [Stegodyphus dumicola]
MPFWSDSSKAENYKAKLEHKMCIAKETPEPVFDLADCNLSDVPSGVFSMCRVFLKETLLLQNNQLTSLQGGGSLTDLSHLQVLNLMNNKLSSLPEDIGHLTHLQDLNVENNRLKKLPVSFRNLQNLHYLNLKGNKLTAFPMSVCLLLNLQSLNICDNPKIKTLPKELGCLEFLKSLLIDAECFSYPPQDICVRGTECIMRFLCQAIGKEYSISSPANSPSQTTDDGANNSSTSQKLVQCVEISSPSEQRQQDLLMMEEALKESYEMQSASIVDATTKRQKLLQDIAQEQERMENEIMLLQSKKEKERQNLLSILANVEDHSAKLIEQLMSLNDRTKSLSRMLEVLEKDRLENELFCIKQEEVEQLRKKEILEAMTEMLQCEENQRKHEARKFSVVEQLQNDENESYSKLHNLFQEREMDQQILINELLEEEQYQKEAFKALQLQKDLQHQEIIHQIYLIEKELANLTMAEVKKKDFKLNSEVNVLAEHRTALAYLLSDLLAAKKKREEELKKRLQEMDLLRAHEAEDFWLIQYQKLLDRKPKDIIYSELEMDSEVKYVLMEASAHSYLPLFAVKGVTFSQLVNYTVKDLKAIGVLDEDMCDEILAKALENFKNVGGDGSKTPDMPKPSAPPDESPTEVQPSAPLLSPDTEAKLWCQTECVICLDVESSAVFLPCGHVCCCLKCSGGIELCPMCRTAITSKFVLTAT